MKVGFLLFSISLFLGVGSEGRLRMGERRGQGILEIESESRLRAEGRKMAQTSSEPTSQAMPEGRVRQDKSSAVITSPTEGRMRSQITSSVTVPVAESRLRSNDSARMGGATKGAGSKYGSSLHDHITPSPPAATRDRSPKRPSPVESISTALSSTHISRNTQKALDNPFEEPDADSNNPFGDDFETEQMGNNPFEDDYDESKNPFASDSPTHKSPDEKNPFADDSSKDYESHLNPFGES